jgi:DNA-binding NarL/FixJ family response regulator
MMNKKTVNVLIIDDHPITIEGFERSLDYLAEQSQTLSFKTDRAEDCNTAYHKIKQYSLTQNLDLVILDLSLPAAPNFNLQSGDDLGVMLRRLLPNAKIIVCTSFVDSYRLNRTIKAFSPSGFLNKQDFSLLDFVSAVNKVLANERYYSKTVLNMLTQKSLSTIKLDDHDVLILRELSNGSNMRDLIGLVHLSKSAIDKRKRILKRKFEIQTNSDRDLVLAAREKGFI